VIFGDYVVLLPDFWNAVVGICVDSQELAMFVVTDIRKLYLL
jgi:hypothetical protein